MKLNDDVKTWLMDTDFLMSVFEDANDENEILSKYAAGNLQNEQNVKEAVQTLLHLEDMPCQYSQDELEGLRSRVLG